MVSLRPRWVALLFIMSKRPVSCRKQDILSPTTFYRVMRRLEQIGYVRAVQLHQNGCVKFKSFETTVEGNLALMLVLSQL